MNLRRRIVEIAARGGHVPSALSILDIVWHLYDKILTSDDHFILSKGHGCLALYVVLAAKGIISDADLDSVCTYDSAFGGHPDHTKIPGVEASTGSLGHGLSLAVGVAMGLRIQSKPGRVYCLIGDGEANEGAIWEAALIAGHRGLDTLVCIVDDNASSPIPLRTIGDKFAAFGWRIFNADGHDPASLTNAFAGGGGRQPWCVVARTVKGRGVPEMEADPAAWHHRATQELLK